MNTDRFEQALLAAGADDWIHAGEIAWLAEHEIDASSAEERRRAAVDAIRRLLAKGDARVGDIVDNAFVAWSGEPDQVAERIAGAWETLSREPQPGDICWVETTL
jgi:hypothetical protein